MTRPRSRWLGIALAIAAGAVSATPVRAQRPAYATGLAPELDSATSDALLREIERASGRGLPAEPLLAKAREGRLKRASGARIRHAVAALASRLDSARSALGANTPADGLVAGAEALAAGASPDALRAIHAASVQPSLVASLGALAQLVASGVPVSRATAMIVELLHRRLSPARVIAFGNAVEVDAAGGLPAEDAALLRLRSAAGDRGAAGDVNSTQTAPADLRGAPSQPAGASPRRRP